MGTMFMAILFELTCYYYSFLFVVALLYEKRKEAGALLLAATAMTGFLDWAPTKYLPNTQPWIDLKMLAVARRAVHVDVASRRSWRSSGSSTSSPIPEPVAAARPRRRAVADAGGDDDQDDDAKTSAPRAPPQARRRPTSRQRGGRARARGGRAQRRRRQNERGRAGDVPARPLTSVQRRTEKRAD